MVASMLILLAAHIAVHGYHIALGIPPPAQMRWAVIIPVWCGFSLVHSLYALGWRRVAWLFCLTFVISLAFEYIGVKTGQPFGRYYYSNVLGPKIADTVPLIIPFAYFMMLYPSHVIVNLILDGKPVSRARTWPWMLVAALLTGLVMTAWDLTTDPVMANEVRAWIWLDGGEYFDIPLENFRGWTIVVTVVAFLYRVIEPHVRLEPLGRPRRWITLLPLAGYGTMGLGDSLVGLPVATRLIPPFAMGTPLLAAIMRLADHPRASDQADSSPAATGTTPLPTRH
jgi:uncharacterized membrane protein